MTDISQLRQLLESHRPSTALALIEAQQVTAHPLPLEWTVCQAEALADLDRPSDAIHLLEEYAANQVEDGNPELHARILNLQAQILNRDGRFDDAIWLALQAVDRSNEEDARALALANIAVGYAGKSCWGLSDQYLRDALEISPTNPRVLALQARIRLEADQRLEARSVYERLARLSSPWAQPVALWGLSYTAYLLGDFDLAEEQACEALELAAEFVPALFTLAQISLVHQDLPALERVIAQLRQRSPQAESLTWYEREAQNLSDRLSEPASGLRFRLDAFPTLVQKRNYCGPSTIELVMRYWQGSLEFSNDRIAERIKYPRGGTPIFRMREFFSLAGFSVVRGYVPVDVLKLVLQAGFPVIVQLEYSNTSHVVVAIGYDHLAGVIELQDPMTHAVTAAPVEEFNRRRQLFHDSAVIAFPRGRGLEDDLTRLNVFEEQAFNLADQAVLELEQDRFKSAASLAEQALQRRRSFPFAWLIRLHAALEEWQHADQDRADSANPDILRGEFYNLLARAAKSLPSNQELLNYYAGWAALLERDYARALRAFQDASKADPEDAANHAFQAECLYALRDFETAFEEARRSLELDSSLFAGNLWMARCTAAHGLIQATHFARSAVDLAPSNWQAHLALAESVLHEGKLDLARAENDRAVILASNQPETMLQRSQILAMDQDYQAALQILHLIQNSDAELSPANEFLMLQLLAQITLEQEKYVNALEHVTNLLAIFPDNPWGAHFQAVAQARLYGRRSSAAGTQHDPQQISLENLTEVQTLFERAMTLNADNPQVMYDYLQALDVIGGPIVALELVSKLEGIHPEDGRLLFFKAHLQSEAGDHVQAAGAMLEALQRPDAILNPEELAEAVLLILQVTGPERGVEKIIALPTVENGIPTEEIQRVLSLALAGLGSEYAGLANQLVQKAISENPDDAPLTLALGKTSLNEVEREVLFRRALLLDPAWLPARINLAGYLIEHGQAADALRYTRGYELLDPDLLLVHSQALFAVGLFEEAAEGYQRALSLVADPDSSIYYGIWQAQFYSGWLDKALKTARKALRLFPQEVRWYLWAAETLLRLQRYDEAANMIRRAEKYGLSKEEVLRAAYNNAYACQDYPTALERIDDYLALDVEKRAEGCLGWAEAARLQLLLKLGYEAEAMDFLNDGNLNAKGWGEAALTAYRAGDLGLGLSLAGHALNLDAENYEAMFTRAQTLAELGRDAEAVNALYALLDAHPNDHHAYESLALRIALHGQLEQALQYAERGSALGPDCPFALAVLGMVYFLCGQPDDARYELQRAFARADSQDRLKGLEYWYLLACLQGRLDEANRLRNQMAAEPFLPFRSELLSRIDQLKPTK